MHVKQYTLKGSRTTSQRKSENTWRQIKTKLNKPKHNGMQLKKCGGKLIAINAYIYF